MNNLYSKLSEVEKDEENHIRRVYDSIVMYGDKDAWEDINGVKASDAKMKNLDILVKAVWNQQMIIPSIQSRSISTNGLAQFYTPEVKQTLLESRKAGDPTWYIIGKPLFIKETLDIVQTNLENAKYHKDLVQQWIENQNTQSNTTNVAMAQYYSDLLAYNQSVLKYLDEDITYIENYIKSITATTAKSASLSPTPSPTPSLIPSPTPSPNTRNSISKNKPIRESWLTRKNSKGKLYWVNSSKPDEITYTMPFVLKSTPWRQKVNSKTGVVYWSNPETKKRRYKIPDEIMQVLNARNKNSTTKIKKSGYDNIATIDKKLTNLHLKYNEDIKLLKELNNDRAITLKKYENFVKYIKTSTDRISALEKQQSPGLFKKGTFTKINTKNISKKVLKEMGITPKNFAKVDDVNAITDRIKMLVSTIEATKKNIYFLEENRKKIVASYSKIAKNLESSMKSLKTTKTVEPLNPEFKYLPKQ